MSICDDIYWMIGALVVDNTFKSENVAHHIDILLFDLTRETEDDTGFGQEENIFLYQVK